MNSSGCNPENRAAKTVTTPAGLNPNSEVRGARPPRAWLDAPSRPAFSARDGFPAGAQFPAAGVFREGAENRARGGRARLSISEFGLNPISEVEPGGRRSAGWQPAVSPADSRRTALLLGASEIVRGFRRLPTCETAGCQPALRAASSEPTSEFWLKVPTGSASSTPSGSSRMGGTFFPGLHPGLFTFGPSGAVGWRRMVSGFLLLRLGLARLQHPGGLRFGIGPHFDPVSAGRVVGLGDMEAEHLEPQRRLLPAPQDFRRLLAG